MGLVQTITAPDNTRWATVAQARTRLRLTADSDALLGDLLDEASAIAERVLGRPVARARYLEQVEGLGSPRLRVSRAPVESVLEVTLYDDPVDPSTYQIGDARRGVLLRVGSINWALTSEAVGRSNRIPSGVTFPGYGVDFWAGYSMPETNPVPPGAIPFPAHLRSAALTIVAALYHSGPRDPAVASMSKADRAVSFFPSSGDPMAVPPAALAILEEERDLLP